MATGLLDTSVVIDWDDPAVQRSLPASVSISAISVAELAAGPILASEIAERSSRQARLQQVESTFDPLPFDAAAARSFALVVAAAASAGRGHRSRMVDLLIAATAHAHGLALYTRNPDDFRGLEGLVAVIAV